MACKQLGAELLMDYLLGGLGDGEAARASAHLTDCPDCTERLHTLRGVREVMWATREFQDIAVPPEVHAQILERCREVLAAVEGPVPAAPAGASDARRLGARRAARRLETVRRTAVVLAGLVAAGGLLLLVNALLNPGSSAVGVLEHPGANVEVLAPGAREGVAAADGHPLLPGERVRTTRVRAEARVALVGGGRVRVGGSATVVPAGTAQAGDGSTVRFLTGRRVDVLAGRAFLDLDQREATVVAEESAGRDLVLTAAQARFDLRVLRDLAPKVDVPVFGPRRIVLTVVSGTVAYTFAGTDGRLGAGEQLFLAERRIVRRAVTPESFAARWMADDDLAALPPVTLARLIQGPLSVLDGGRIRLLYTFDSPAEAADWRAVSGTGTWRGDANALVGAASVGQSAIAYHVARFQGDLEVTYNALVEPDGPGAQTLWRLYAEKGPWEVSGFSGWVGVESVQDGTPLRKLSLHYRDGLLASSPAPGLSAPSYAVTAACAAGRVTFKADAVPALTSPVGEAPLSGHVGLGLAGGTVRFTRIQMIGRLEPDWLRVELEQLGEADLARLAAAGGDQPRATGSQP